MTQKITVPVEIVLPIIKPPQVECPVFIEGLVGAENPPKGCWVTLIECVIVAVAVGLVLAGIFVWTCQEVELSAVREQLAIMEGIR